ncbi:MAG: hypothetical protein L0H64_07235 [Pseudonocardia sp.]|nr:hypothetical protein [Pseudonocardia sp.]
MRFWTKRQDRAADEREADALWWAWRQACEGTGLGNQVDTATGATTVVPEVVEIVLGPPTILMVKLMPGQLIGDVRREAGRLAPHLGAAALRVQLVGRIHVRVELLDADPLDGTLPLDLPVAGDGVVLGRDEGGRDLVQDWADLAHAIVQGVTRSGKSVFTYGLLAQMAGDPRITVCGIDPTGLLFRPFAGSRHATHQVSGVADPHAYLRLLHDLVAEMDERITGLPADRDTLEVSVAQPLRLVVLEEYAGLLRTADQDKQLGKDVRAAIGRLLAEGAKAGFRVVIVVQRAEASIVGSYERAMCSLRISFRTDTTASLELLHPGAPKAVAEAHTTALPGIALMSAPGEDLTRFRAPFLGTYGAYVRAVIEACESGVDERPAFAVA